jgi:hypothetical protein
MRCAAGVKDRSKKKKNGEAKRVLVVPCPSFARSPKCHLLASTPGVCQGPSNEVCPGFEAGYREL